MKILLRKKVLPIYLIVGAFMLPLFASAESVSVKLSQPIAVHVGDVVTVPLGLSVSGEIGVNTLAAQVNVSGPATIESVRTGNSIFSLWPQWDIGTNNTLTFVGGTPSSVSGTSLHVLSLDLRATQAGTVSVSVSDATAYAGDGKGTPSVIPPTRITFDVLISTSTGPHDAFADVRARDRTPPDPFDISVSRDESVFEGRYFIAFQTSDRGTGVRKYEIREGQLPSVEATSPYVLQDQSFRGAIEVRAYDDAGNVRIARIGPSGSWSHEIGWGTVLLSILFAYALSFGLARWRAAPTRLS